MPGDNMGVFGEDLVYVFCVFVISNVWLDVGLG